MLIRRWLRLNTNLCFDLRTSHQSGVMASKHNLVFISWRYSRTGGGVSEHCIKVFKRQTKLGGTKLNAKIFHGSFWLYPVTMMKGLQWGTF